MKPVDQKVSQDAVADFIKAYNDGSISADQEVVVEKGVVKTKNALPKKN